MPSRRSRSRLASMTYCRYVVPVFGAPTWKYTVGRSAEGRDVTRPRVTAAGRAAALPCEGVLISGRSRPLARYADPAQATPHHAEPPDLLAEHARGLAEPLPR